MSQDTYLEVLLLDLCTLSSGQDIISTWAKPTSVVTRASEPALEPINFKLWLQLQLQLDNTYINIGQ